MDYVFIPLCHFSYHMLQSRFEDYVRSILYMVLRWLPTILRHAYAHRIAWVRNCRALWMLHNTCFVWGTFACHTRILAISNCITGCSDTLHYFGVTRLVRGALRFQAWIGTICLNRFRWRSGTGRIQVATLVGRTVEIVARARAAYCRRRLASIRTVHIYHIASGVLLAQSVGARIRRTRGSCLARSAIAGLGFGFAGPVLAPNGVAGIAAVRCFGATTAGAVGWP